MDDVTRTHPATQRFLAFAKKAKTAESYDELIKEFYAVQTQKRLANLLGWQHFVYSSAFKALNNGHCESIQIKQPLGNRVQIDCFGTTIIQSMFLGDHEEPMHLRVKMVLQEGQWYLDQSGYVYANSGSLPLTYGRAGIRFNSPMEQ